MYKFIISFLFIPLILNGAQNNFPVMVDTNFLISYPSNKDFVFRNPGVLIPVKSEGALFSFGDSQTAGYNFSGKSYTDGVDHILPQYRWVSLLASNNNRNLSVSNWGIGASQLAMGGAANPPSSIFNSTGRLTNNWKGVVTILAGWNDLGNYVDSDKFFSTMTHAYEAMIAKCLIDDWFALSFVGWSRANQFSLDTPNWATSADFLQNYQWTTTDRDSIPLWFQSAPARYAISFTGAQTNQFAFIFKKAGVLFFDTTPNSGMIYILLNQTNLVGKYNLDTSAVSSSSHWPFCVWLENLPTNALITITNNLAANKTNLFLGAGWVTNYTRNPDRTIILGATTGNTNSLSCITTYARNTTNLFSLAKAGEAAVASFSRLGYPVYFANCYNNYVYETDPECCGDPAHFTPTGNIRIFQAFNAAYTPSGFGSSNVVYLGRSVFDIKQ